MQDNNESGFLPKGALKPWCAYCDAFIEGTGWHLKADCPYGKMGASQIAEQIEKSNKHEDIQKRIDDLEKALENYRRYKTENLETDVMDINEIEERRRNILEMKIDNLEARLKEVERFQEITHRQYQKNRSSMHPHICPMCQGNKTIFTEFISRQTMSNFDGKYRMDEQGRTVMACPTCSGDGMVWG